MPRGRTEPIAQILLLDESKRGGEVKNENKQKEKEEELRSIIQKDRGGALGRPCDGERRFCLAKEDVEDPLSPSNYSENGKNMLPIMMES